MCSHYANGDLPVIQWGKGDRLVPKGLFVGNALVEIVHIVAHLVKLNELGFWTFSSQPWSSVENPRGSKQEQLEYVAGMIHPTTFAYLEERLAQEHPDIRWSSSVEPTCLPTSRNDGACCWYGLMAPDAYVERFGDVDIAMRLVCVKFVNVNWMKQDDYLFTTLVGLLMEYDNTHE